MKKFLALILTVAMVSSLLCGMTVFADDEVVVEDGTYEVAVTVTGDKCQSLDGQEIDPWANAKLKYTITGGAVAKQAYLVNDYYQIGYWPATNELSGANTFAYTSADYNGMDVVFPSGIGAYTLVDGTTYEAKAITDLVAKRTSDNVQNDDYAILRGKTNVGKVIVSEGITTIGQGAFAKINTKVMTFVFPSTITSYGQKMFASALSSNKSALAEVTIIGKLPESLNTNTFNAGKLTALDLSQTYGLTTLPAAAFGSATNLATLKLPSSLTSIAGGAFYPYKNLTTFDFPEEIAGYKLVNGAVYTAEGTALVSYPGATGDIVIPDTVTEIQASALRSTDVTSVVVPETVTAIGTYAFAANTAMESITLPTNIAYGEGALDGCTALTTINGSNGYYDFSDMTSIGQYAFRNCNSLTGTMKIGIGEMKKDLFRSTDLKKIIFTNNIKFQGTNTNFSTNSGHVMEIVFLGKITNTSSGVFSNTIYYPVDVDATNFTSSKSYFNGEKVVYGGYIDSVTMDGDSATVTYSNASTYGGKKGILAFYKTVDGQEVLVKVKSVTLTDDIKNFTTVTVSGTEGAETVKLLTWEDLSSATPLYTPWIESLVEEVAEEPAA